MISRWNAVDKVTQADKEAVANVHGMRARSSKTAREKSNKTGLRRFRPDATARL